MVASSVCGGYPALRSLLRLVVDHNPFYPLSAVCMMAGCLTLTNSLSYSPLKAGQLLALVFTLNAYELLLVGLGLFLIVRRGVRRDGLFLLLIEAAFLVDMAFLNAEVYSIRPGLGLVVNLIVYGLAVCKLVAIFRVLGFPAGDGLLAFVLGELAVLFAVPGVFAKMALGADGRISAWLMYGAWCAVGVLPVWYVMGVRPRGLLGVRSGDLVRDVLAKVLVLSPVVSLIVHLGTANWVYKLHFTMANVAPLLVGLAVAVGHHDSRESTYGRRVHGQFWLAALGVLISTNFPSRLTYEMVGPDWTPLRIMLLAAGAVYLDGYWTHRQPVFGFAAGLCAAGFGMGPSVSEMGDNMRTAAGRGNGLLERLTPQTPREWGVMSVVMSFLLLGLGFVVSLLKPAGLVEISDDTVVGD